MRTTFVLDDVLLAKAQDLTQLWEKTALIADEIFIRTFFLTTTMRLNLSAKLIRMDKFKITD